MTKTGVDIKEIQDKITSEPKYKQREKTAGRPHKYTDDMEERLVNSLEK